MNVKMNMTRSTRGKRFKVRLGVTACALVAMTAWSSKETLGKPTIKRKPDANVVPLAVDKPSAGAPVIHADEPIYDFGERWIGPNLEHTFIIQNNGKAPLNISSVRPSCGCTVTGNYPKTIQPGEKGEFPFKIASKKLRGKYEKSIKVYSNDPETPELQLKLRGVCKRYVEVTPTNAYFGKITTDEPRENVLKITNNTDKPLSPSLSKAEDGKFQFELVEKVKGKEYELKVRVEPPYIAGSLRGTTNLLTNIEAQKEIRIGATARIPERLEVQPPSIVLSPQRTKDRGYSRPIRFTNYGDKPVKVLAATVDDDKIKVAVKERTDGKAYTINVEMPAGYVPPSGGRVITLKTDDPDKPTIAIPVTSVQALRAPKAATIRTRPAEQMVGKAAPSIPLLTTGGKRLTDGDFRGKVTVLDFFAVNCGFCKKQIPRLETIRKEYAPKGVRFVNISQTMRKRFTDNDVKNKIKELGFGGELAIDHENKAGPLFKATSFPTMVVIGKDAKVAAVNIGNVGDLESRMRTQLDALLAGKSIPRIASTKSSPTPPKPKTQAKANTPRNAAQGEVVGKPAPKFNLTTTDGKPLSNATLANRVTVLDFFAVNCGFCKKQIPRLEVIRKEYESKGVRFVAVSQTMRKPFTEEETKNKIKELGFGGELALDPKNTTGPKMGARGFPTMVVLDKKGKVAAANIGNLGDLETRLRAQLDALLAEKPVPAQYVGTTARKSKSRRRPAEDLVGKPAPKFATMKTLAGKDISNADFAKRPATVLNFVAPNCGFCKRALPKVEAVRKEYEAKGVRFVNVAQTMRKEYTTDEVVDIFTKVGSNLELAHDAKNVMGKKFKAVSFPTMVVVGRSGKVAAVNIGAKANLETLLKGQLDKLLAK